MTDNNPFLNTVTSIGDKQEYFPGTGGNISLKIGDGVMVIKASGKRIGQMCQQGGVVSLSFLPIKKFFESSKISQEGEKESISLTLDSVVQPSQGRPSIETGFHTLLGDAVIHSHSAFVNIASCSAQFERIIETVFFGSQIRYVCLPYTQPGYYLTHALLDVVSKISNKPRVFFMKNHGVIVSAPTLDEAVLMHEEVNQLLKTYFGCSNDSYPRAALHHLDENLSRSATSLLIDFVKQNAAIFLTLEDNILFPDLGVFCDDIVCVDSFDVPKAKITIEKSTGCIYYQTSKQEAHCIEENLAAYAFLMTQIKEHHLSPVSIPKEAVHVIKNMEQEKYRKMLLVS